MAIILYYYNILLYYITILYYYSIILLLFYIDTINVTTHSDTQHEFLVDRKLPCYEMSSQEL